jgi:hypothetical protein
MKYRKKPVVIDAVQWFKFGDHPAVKQPTKFTGDVVKDGGIIPTLEGWHAVSPGDWIITGIKGEHYPCKPDIFYISYELID